MEGLLGLASADSDEIYPGEIVQMILDHIEVDTQVYLGIDIEVFDPGVRFLVAAVDVADALDGIDKFKGFVVVQIVHDFFTIMLEESM